MATYPFSTWHSESVAKATILVDHFTSQNIIRYPQFCVRLIVPKTKARVLNTTDQSDAQEILTM